MLYGCLFAVVEFLGKVSLFVVLWCIIRIWQLGTILLETYSTVYCGLHVALTESYCWESQYYPGSPQLEWRELPVPDYVGDLQWSPEVLRDCSVRPKTTNAYWLVQPTVLPPCISLFLRIFAELYTNYSLNRCNSRKGKCSSIVSLAQVWCSFFFF